MCFSCVCTIITLECVCIFPSLYTLSVFNVFDHANSRHKKGKKEYAVHYVKEGPKVDITGIEPQYETVTEPQYAAGAYVTMCIYVCMLLKILLNNNYSDQ